MPTTPMGGPLRRDLEAALATDEFNEAFETIKRMEGVFGKYPTLEALVALAQPGCSDHQAKDQVLCALLGALQAGGVILFPLLNLMFWNSLERLYRRRRRGVTDPEELFCRIQSEFFHVATSYPLDRRPRKVDVNLVLDVKKRISRWQAEESRYKAGLDALAEGEVPSGEPEPEPSPGELEQYLLELVYTGVITEQQFDLLLETKVRGRTTLKAWGEAHGVPEGTVRSWVFSAGEAIRRYRACPETG